MNPTSGLFLLGPYERWIDKIMEAKREPVKKLQQEKEANEELRKTWKELASYLSRLRFASSDLKLTSSFFEKSVEYETGQNVARVAVKPSAREGTYTIKVKSLASRHRISTDPLPRDGPMSLSGSFFINGKEVILTDTDTLENFASKINALQAGVKAYVIDKYVVIESEKPGVDNTIKLKKGTGDLIYKLGLWEGWRSVSSKSFKTKGNPGLLIKFKVKVYRDEPQSESAQVQDIPKPVIVVKADHFVKQLEATSGVKFVSFPEGASRVKIFVKIPQGDWEEYPWHVDIYNIKYREEGVIKNELSKPSDAVFYFNGIKVVRSYNEDINDVVPGLSIDLISTGTTRFRVVMSGVDASENIKKFVDAYNKVVEKIRTDERLDTDMTASSILSRLRDYLFRSYPASRYRTLFAIGISTGRVGESWENIRMGYLSIDEKKLQKCLEESPEDVMKVFACDTDGDGIRDDGVAVKIERYLRSVLGPGGIVQAKFNTFDSRQRELDRRIADAEESLKKERIELIKKFAKLQQALTMYKERMNYLRGLQPQAGGLSGLGQEGSNANTGK